MRLDVVRSGRHRDVFTWAIRHIPAFASNLDPPRSLCISRFDGCTDTATERPAQRLSSNGASGRRGTTALDGDGIEV
ncbi:hypothetical protein GSI_08527 [Ganoderma sinense ZZ0214-1]|uniref:Uncharacterized protein n=1 Tax=Ganoderma sinense ZZ0214-1 TaxID=1077348 RepID=A0A2G8S3Y6_9APHY|nr:hypothetical protein GSI_08527 [Ganoderma sinense ZZ0214-1]